jgi:pSer/pThr/pTyr-binding forkhead associated (FHA) protein
MVLCPDCGAAHPLNTQFCDECGAKLIRAAEAIRTSPAEHDSESGESQAPASSAIPVASGIEPAATVLHINLVTPDRTRAFGLDLHDTLLIGRIDRSSTLAPDVDLTMLQAVRLGVSRRHARLLRTASGVALEDLKSLNGTFVSGQRLGPHQPQPLRSGDELSFGELALVISF